MPAAALPLIVTLPLMLAVEVLAGRVVVCEYA
jgi:hypothetical protein